VADNRNSTAPAAVWQGFHHRWTYNHRLNRLGSWIEHVSREGDSVTARAAHAAASGSGEDDAAWESFYSVVQADGVSCCDAEMSFVIDGREGSDQTFVREVREVLPAGMVNRDVYTVLLNGFDLVAEGDADKLASFHLFVTPPQWRADSRALVFSLAGGLNVDCDSAECDGYPSLGVFFAALTASWATGVNPLAGAGLALLPSLLQKLDVATRYRLTVRLLIVAGDADALHVTTAGGSTSYDWDTTTAIQRRDAGVVRKTVVGDTSREWVDSVPGVSQLSLDVRRERGLFRPDSAMHLLQWDAAVRPVERTPTQCTADLHIFFRNWMEAASPYMSGLEGALLTHRDAGAASLTLGVTLLQFGRACAIVEDSRSGLIHWDGGNAPAESPLAEQRRTFSHTCELAAAGPSRRRRWLAPALQLMLQETSNAAGQG
jgi:hypothetical protein